MYERSSLPSEAMNKKYRPFRNHHLSIYGGKCRLDGINAIISALLFDIAKNCLQKVKPVHGKVHFMAFKANEYRKCEPTMLQSLLYNKRVIQM